MKTENATGDAPRLYQAVLSHLQSCLWTDQRNAHTFAWMVTGLLCSQRASIPSWLPHIQSRATFAQSTERRVRRWLGNPAIDPTLGNPAIDPTSIYGPLITRALRDWGEHPLVPALDTSVLFERCVRSPTWPSALRLSGHSRLFRSLRASGPIPLPLAFLTTDANTGLWTLFCFPVR